MDRLQMISRINPIWAFTIRDFVDEYPEFTPYLYLVPVNPIEKIGYKNVSTLFESIMHYICSAGVRYSYAVKQWDIIYPLISSSNWEIIMENIEGIRNNINIQPKKREIYYNLCRYMNENHLNSNNITTNNLKNIQKNVGGIGVGCVAWCKKYFSNDDDCIEYTDLMFKKGFSKLYNTNSISAMKLKSEEWINKNFGRVANLFIINIGGYT